MALARSARPTRSTVIAWYEGPAKAQQHPVTNDSKRIIQMSAALLTTRVKTSTASVRAESPAPTCVKMSRRLRSTMSA